MPCSPATDWHRRVVATLRLQLYTTACRHHGEWLVDVDSQCTGIRNLMHSCTISIRCAEYMRPCPLAYHGGLCSTNRGNPAPLQLASSTEYLLRAETAACRGQERKGKGRKKWQVAILSPQAEQSQPSVLSQPGVGPPSGLEGLESQTEKVGVLLLNLGGPETLADVQPFLYNLFNDDSIIRLPPQGTSAPPNSSPVKSSPLTQQGSGLQRGTPF